MASARFNGTNTIAKCFEGISISVGFRPGTDIRVHAATPPPYLGSQYSGAVVLALMIALGRKLGPAHSEDGAALAAHVTCRISIGPADELWVWKQVVKSSVKICEPATRPIEGTASITWEGFHGQLPLFALARVLDTESGCRLNQQLRDLCESDCPKSYFRLGCENTSWILKELVEPSVVDLRPAPVRGEQMLHWWRQ